MSFSHIIWLPPLSSVRDMIKLYKLRAMKELSQNFLMDSRLISHIVRSAGSVKNCEELCEVGLGPVNITRSIVENMPSRVFTIEKDKRFIPSLELLTESSPVPLELIIGVVTNFNLEKLFNEDFKMEWEDKCPQIHLIGNLPFNVSTPLIIWWLKIYDKSNAWSYGRLRMSLTFQKGVAKRMATPIMTKGRSRLFVRCQNWCRVEQKFNILDKACIPKSDVDVSVLRLTLLKKPIVLLLFETIEKVVRCVFSYRQKHCIQGVETLFPKPVGLKFSSEFLSAAAVKPDTRSFQLTVSKFGQICEAYVDMQKKSRLFEVQLSKDVEIESLGSNQNMILKH